MSKYSFHIDSVIEYMNKVNKEIYQKCTRIGSSKGTICECCGNQILESFEAGEYITEDKEWSYTICNNCVAMMENGDYTALQYSLTGDSEDIPWGVNIN
jgi:hypothetical protein